MAELVYAHGLEPCSVRIGGSSPLSPTSKNNMNLIGHNFIAKKVLNKYNPLIAAGSHIPDLVPFVKDSVLEFNEAHEGSKTIYDWIKDKDPQYLDLALGIMIHSVEFGVDKYNRDIPIWLLKDNDYLKKDIANKISTAANISLEAAQTGRLHNYLWAGLDFYIIDTYPKFIKEINENYKHIDVEQLSNLLSNIFNKDKEKIKGNLTRHFNLIVNRDIKDKKDFVLFWKTFTSELPENDNVDVEKAVKVIGYIERTFENEWEKILNILHTNIKNRMKDYL